MTTADSTWRPSHDVPLVSVEWLASTITTATAPIILCASMGDPTASKEAGIPGAVLADLDADFSETSSALPHTIPSDLPALLERYGISDDSTVVVYDRHGLVVAPRVWWLLKMAGLHNIGVLDGGLPAWIAAGHDMEPLAEPAGGGVITTEVDHGLLVGAADVEKALSSSSMSVVDARSAGRFAGTDPEPREGLSRGHIPGSVNLPFTELIDAQGLLKTPTEVDSLLRSVTGDSTTAIFSCGSGVTACVNAFAAIVAGWNNVLVYDGSWAEWGNPENKKPLA